MKAIREQRSRPTSGGEIDISGVDGEVLRHGDGDSREGDDDAGLTHGEVWRWKRSLLIGCGMIQIDSGDGNAALEMSRRIARTTMKILRGRVLRKLEGYRRCMS